MSLEVGVVRFPGTNCETETVRAVRDTIPSSHVEILDHRRTDIARFDAVILPGGFAYGDYLRAGAIAARAPIGDAVRAFARDGGVVVGFCNGFQQLQELGMLPGALILNQTLHYVCATVHLRVEGRPSAATCALDSGTVYQIPIAHGEGCFWADDEEIRSLEDHGQIVLRYCDANGDCSDESNPNGSRGHIAGICNQAGNVVGMMPHPERNADPLVGNADGVHIFRSLASYCLREAA